MSYRIRICTEADAEALSDLLVRTWHATFDSIYGVEKVNAITSKWHAPATLMPQLSQAGSITLAADLDGTIIGTATGSSLQDGGIKLQRLYVAPEHQRRGVGSALMAAFVASFVQPARLELNVAIANAKAIAFYEARGFAVISTENLNASGETVQLMSRYLDRVPASGTPLLIRPVRDGDAQDLIGLITLCFAEHPGCYFDPHGDMPDIVRPAQSSLAQQGQFLVVEDDRGQVCACIGVDFPSDTNAELHRLYVRPDMRGRGLAKYLTRRMEGHAIERGASRMILWSDTRFTKAHALYRGLGYAAGTTRSLGDVSTTREFFFQKALGVPEADR